MRAPWAAGEVFPCLSWSCGIDITADQRHATVCSLIDAGCRYFVCGGHDSEKWEEAADEYTSFDVHDFKRHLVVAVGCDDDSVRRLSSAVTKQAVIAALPPSGSSA